MNARIAMTVVLIGFTVALGADPSDMRVLPINVTVPARAELPAKNFTQAILDSKVKFEMVYVPGGEFTIGSPDDEPARKPDEGPRRRVQVRPFWLAKYETTWDEFNAFSKDETLFNAGTVPDDLRERATPDALTRPTPSFVDEYYGHGEEGFPALCMTHHAAMMYCHWLRYRTRLGYRLPTEAEWEFACRAGRDEAYGIPPGAKLGDYAWFKENSATRDHERGTTHKVGSKKPNGLGLHDLHGNVAEWVLDHYDADAYAKLPADKLSLGPVNKPTDKKFPHVVRGGSWADAADRLRCAARRASDKSWQKHDPQVPQSVWWLTKMDVIGFRVALPVEEYPELVGLKPLVVKREN